MSSLQSFAPMCVNRTQKFFTYAGYHANCFLRGSVRNIERLTRPMPKGADDYCPELVERIKRVASTIFSVPLALVLMIPAFTCYVVASCAGSGRFEVIEPETPAKPWEKKTVKVLAINACLQDPWSPLTGGVESPTEPMIGGATRVAALANEIAREKPQIVFGQEFENLGAQDEFIYYMKKQGFQYFVRDLGSNDPVRNSDAGFVASKIPLEEVAFTPYKLEDREALSKWSNQGVLSVKVSVGGETFRFLDVHLNYGNNTQGARNRQLKDYAVPLLTGSAVLVGDINFDTTNEVYRAASGLEGFSNALQGKVTCTDDGTLRGKPGCKEKIDALIYDPKQVKVIKCVSKTLTFLGKRLSDHNATIAIIGKA
jgi:endonuclease/exonuclease/phosphatase family metal-dependent hydrolase